MRIGLIAPPWVPVPPPAYGGTEVVVDNLARGLRRRGHDVELFTVEESTCPVRRRHLYKRAVVPLGDGAHEAAHVLAAYRALAGMDVIHDHTTLGALVGLRNGRPQAPVVVTNHGPFTVEARAILGEIAPRVHVVAISHSQARAAGPIPISAVIHHGVDTDAYQPGPGGGGYLLFIGRMSPDKGVHRAVRVARQAGRPLRIVTKMREPAERAYFEQRVLPLLDRDDPLPREEPLAARIELLRHADALLDPIRWPEPFGLVMIESLASGVPVLAFPSGAAPEIVDHGRTGFLCRTEAEMARAVGRLDEIDRAACRAAAEERFSMKRMVDDHLALYERAIAGTVRPIAGSLVSQPQRSLGRLSG